VREFLKATDIANEISMKRSFFNGSFLVVEGVTDGRLYGKFIDSLECGIVPAHSKDNVILSVREVSRRRNDKKVIGIVDSDSDRLNDVVYGHPLFMTDCRDLETMMLRSSALTHVLSEYADPNKLSSFVNRYGGIRDVLISACYPLGVLMYLSEENEYGLSFRDIEHQQFVDKKNLRTDTETMVNAVVKNSPHVRVGTDTLMTHLRKELKKEHDPWNVCRGHDLVAVLTVGLREIFGSYNCRNIRHGELAGALRLAYDRTSFETTALFKDTKEWSSSRNIKIWSQISSF